MLTACDPLPPGILPPSRVPPPCDVPRWPTRMRHARAPRTARARLKGWPSDPGGVSILKLFRWKSFKINSAIFR